MQQTYEILSLDELARRLGLSRRWLHKEAMAGRIPSLKAGRSRRYNANVVSRTLAARAAGITCKEAFND